MEIDSFTTGYPKVIPASFYHEQYKSNILILFMYVWIGDSIRNNRNEREIISWA